MDIRFITVLEGKLSPPMIKKISDSIKKISFEEIKWDNKKTKVNIIDENFDDFYFKKIISNSILEKKNRKKFKNSLFITPSGTGIKSVPQLLKAGYNDINLVENQCFIDENFLNTSSSNPEDNIAFNETINLADKINGEIIITTDPDADRLGVGVRDFKKDWILLNGNQLMILLFSFLIERKEFKNEDFFRLNHISFITII